MIFKFFRFGLLLSLLFFSCILRAQVSHGGSPVFKYGKAKSQLSTYKLPAFKSLLKNELSTDKKLGMRLKYAQYAYRYNVQYHISDHGNWEELWDSRKVWRLKIESEGAYSLGLIFSKFKLPKGGQLFVYNNESNRVLGAYTEKNNKKSGRFSIEPLQGDQLILEYIEPVDAEFLAELEVEAVLHDYKNIFNLLKGSGSIKSGACNVDINCPEGDGWQVEKRSVCHILYNGSIASGALINNTNQDGRPFLLTAYHVIHEQEDADVAIFYFNYENSSCDSGDGEKLQSISGSTLRATIVNLDFALLELSVAPPASYKPYYSGWDRSGRIPAFTTSIHHPDGDAKKISIDNDTPVTATYSDNRYTFDTNSSWKILDWEVGTTEGGSSGSPLFDENHRIIGDLTGGEAYCGNPVNDYYAKISESWENYPNSNEQLKYWLDPVGLGVETLDGYNPYGNLLANFTASSDTICYTSTVNIIDFSNGVPDTYSWDFGEGATPAFSSEIGPHTISYHSPGIKQVKLIISKDGVEDMIVKNIVVLDFPVADFDYSLEKLTVNMVDLSVDASTYLWSFGDGGSSTGKNSVHEYASSGKYTVTLNVENICGITEVSKDIRTSYNDQLKVYPNPSTGKYTIDVSKIIYSKINWSVYTVAGAKVRNGTITQFSNRLEFDLSGLSAGVYVLKINVDGEVLKRKLLLVK